MVTDVDICNFALQNIGGAQITALNQGTPSADACNLRYDTMRKAALEIHPWNFAQKRVALALSTESPAFGYTNQFDLPSDFLALVATDKQLSNSSQIGNPDFNGYLTVSNSVQFSELDNYKIEAAASDGKLVLMSDDSEKKILYTYNCKDESKFSGLFVEFFSRILGAALAYRISGNKNLAKEELEEALTFLEKARGVDAKQGTYERQEISTFLASRF